MKVKPSKYSLQQLPPILSAVLTLFLLINPASAIGPESTQGASPQVAEAYALLEAGDSELALEAFNKALEANAKDLPARLGQAMIFADQLRHEDAFSSYDYIVQHYPHHAFAWHGRGIAAFNMKDFDEALTSFEQATADQPINGFFYESLAWTHMCRGEFPEAVNVAKKATLMYNQNGQSLSYALLIAYFSSMESGDRAEAQRTLSYAMKNRPANQSWPAPVFDYVAGRIEKPELISFVSDKAQETEAHTYIGLNLRAKGAPEEAKLHLDWVARKGDQRVFEYTLAHTFFRPNEIALLER